MQERKILYGGQYEEPTGTATLTKGYNLPCDYVIHTVGPIIYGELTDINKADLQNCYKNILNCCVENKISSVVFCCISTGEFHLPNEEAARIAIETVTNFLENHKNTGIERIVFNVFTEKDLTIYKKALLPSTLA